MPISPAPQPRRDGARCRLCHLASRLVKADWERMSYADAVQRGIDAIGKAHMSDEPHRLMTAFLERKKQPRQ